MKRWKVYRTDLDDGTFYIGYSGKRGKAFDKYFGSGKEVKAYKGGMKKRVLSSYDKKSHARFKEMLVQIKYMKDPKCLNKRIKIDIYLKNLQDFPK